MIVFSSFCLASFHSPLYSDSFSFSSFAFFLLLFLCFLSPSLSLLSLPPSLSLHAGKSCVIDSLLGKPYDPNSESTRGADVSRCTVDTTNVKAWAAQKAEEAGGQLEQVK